MSRLPLLVAFALAACKSPAPADSRPYVPTTYVRVDATTYVPLNMASAAAAKHYTDSLAAANGPRERRERAATAAAARRTEAAAELRALQLVDIDAHVTVTGAAADHLTIALPLADDARTVILQDRFGEAWQAVGFRKVTITSDIGGQSWTFSYPAP